MNEELPLHTHTCACTHKCCLIHALCIKSRNDPINCHSHLPSLFCPKLAATRTQEAGVNREMHVQLFTHTHAHARTHARTHTHAHTLVQLCSKTFAGLNLLFSRFGRPSVNSLVRKYFKQSIAELYKMDAERRQQCPLFYCHLCIDYRCQYGRL